MDGNSRSLLGAAALLAGLPSTALASDLPKYAPPPAWVIPVPIPQAKLSAGDSALQPLLIDTQARYAPEGDTSYGEVAFKIVTPDGLKGLGSISPSWNPDTDTLTFNRVVIVRDGKSIDLMDGGKNVTVIRRETGLESAALDGTLTATIQPQGLQVGDIIDFAITDQHHDPVAQGRSQGLVPMLFVGQATHYYVRVSWPDSKPVRWRPTVGMPMPVVMHASGETIVTIDQNDLIAPKAPSNAPPQYRDIDQLQFSEFVSWSEVSALLAPLYAKAEVLTPDSSLQSVIGHLRKDHPDMKSRVEAALRLTQDQVHYVFLGMNFGGYVPAGADLTWSRRFGDCKGKTALLLAILHGLGVEAEPVLASTVDGAGLDKRLPNLAFFDHVFVRAIVNGKTYWLDGTRTGDRNLDYIPIPDFHWVLPIRSAPSELVQIEPNPFIEPAFERNERIDLTAGSDGAAPTHVDEIYRGDIAVGWKIILDQKGRVDAIHALTEYWRAQKPWITPKTVEYAYDDASRVMRLTLDGTAAIPWTTNPPYREFDVAESSLGFEANFKRDPGPNADAPIEVSYPSYSKWAVVLKLPDHGRGFSVVGPSGDVDKTIGGREYVRHAALNNGEMTVTTEEKSLAPEFPFAQAPEAQSELHQLYAYNVSLRLSDASSTADNDDFPTKAPTSAAEFNLRGVSYLEKHKYELAVADFTQAANLEPTASKHFYDRGVAYYELGKDDLALENFNHALQLNPFDTFALMGRADLELDHREPEKAQADFDAAVKLAKDKSSVLWRESNSFERAKLYPKEVLALDALLASAADDKSRGKILNARCWTRAEWGEQLSQALEDCASAIRVQPQDADSLDSRGFVHLRLRQYDQAIGDFEQALKLNPDLPTSLYGKGVAEIADGKSAVGQSDVKSAVALDSAVETTLSPFKLSSVASTKP
jgi:tetratricopeptide (TPR) repeat protein